MQYPLKIEQKNSIRLFLSQYQFTRQNYEFSYQFWAKGGRGWGRTFQSGGADIMNALMWYHHVYKHQSREWRPRVIMDALCKAASVATAA